MEMFAEHDAQKKLWAKLDESLFLLRTALRLWKCTDCKLWRKFTAI